MLCNVYLYKKSVYYFIQIIMKKQNPLLGVGLSSDDIIVYECLLQKGNLSPTELCKYSKLYRPTVYMALENLENKNLVTVIPAGKRKKYTALPPKQLKNLLHAQEDVVTKEIIRLEELQIAPKNLPKVIVLSGKNALRTIYEEMTQELKKGDVYYRYQAVDSEVLQKGNYMSNKARALRNAKQLERFVITNTNNKKKIKPFPARYVKTIPNSLGLFDHGVAQFMYSNKTAIVDYHNETATIIESDSITSFQKAIFKSLFHYI